MPRDPSEPDRADSPPVTVSSGEPRPIAESIGRRVMSRRAFLGLLGLGGATMVTGGSVASAYRFQVERISAPIAGLRRPLTLAWLCDMHFGPFIREGSVAAWVDATLELAPDLVVLGGDLVDHHAPDDVAPLIAELRRLEAPLGVYSVLGNHEYARFGRGGALDAFVADLLEAGMPTLVNRGILVRDDLYLAGIDAAGGGARRILRALQERPTGVAALVAAHKPDVLPLIPEDVALTLCGHTHGGQVRLPGIGPLLFDSRISRDYSSGWYRSPSLGYVSRGLGVGYVPVRIACPAELTFATLVPA